MEDLTIPAWIEANYRRARGEARLIRDILRIEMEEATVGDGDAVRFHREDAHRPGYGVRGGVDIEPPAALRCDDTEDFSERVATPEEVEYLRQERRGGAIAAGYVTISAIAAFLMAFVFTLYLIG